jgi:hypothetical protein
VERLRDSVLATLAVRAGLVRELRAAVQRLLDAARRAVPLGPQLLERDCATPRHSLCSGATWASSWERIDSMLEAPALSCAPTHRTRWGVTTTFGMLELASVVARRSGFR